MSVQQLQESYPHAAFGFSFRPMSTTHHQPSNTRNAPLRRWEVIMFSSNVDDGSSGETSTKPRKKPLSPKEILERQRAMQGLPDDDDEYPKLFEDDLLNDMQEMLLILEKRVQDGPGSISILQVEEFVSMSNNVLAEMSSKERERLQDAAPPPPAAVSATAAASISDATTVSPPLPPLPQPTTTNTATTIPTTEVDIKRVNDDLEDGPAYDPSGGQGSLAKGTRNTYVIPRMEEMSPEEYQKALQQSMLEQQLQRRRKMAENYGNRASWDYLNNLSGESGQLKKPQKQLKSDSAFDD